MAGAVPEVDDEVRHRLGRRYGPMAGPWLDELPARLAKLAELWELELGSFIRRGTVSVVVACLQRHDTPCVLKVSPNIRRIAVEADALRAWRTRRVPRVFGTEARSGALLLEEIRPGVALDESGRSLEVEALAELVGALHRHGPPPASVPGLEDRIAALFTSGEANYARRPDLEDVVPPSMYARGRRAAMALGATSSGTVLHGDLTPANVLDGGPRRGFVAIDPAPCRGDPAFDLVDLLIWHIDDLHALTHRADALGRLLDLPAGRVLDWCAAFAPMNALELTEATSPGAPVSGRLAILLDLARSL